MNVDGFAPSFRVEVDNALLEADASAAVSELSVTRQPGTIGECSLTLANPLPDMRWTHAERDAKVFEVGNNLTVKLGYGNTLHTVFDGTITKLAAAFPDGGSPTLRVDGQTKMYQLAQGSNTRTFSNVTDGDIAKRIASDLKLQLEADETKPVHAYVVQAGQSDLAFLLDRGTRIGFTVSVEGSKLLFKSGGPSPGPPLALVYGSTDAPGVPKDALPLRSFTPTMNPTKPVTEVIVRYQQPNDPVAKEARAGEADAKVTMKGKKKGSTAAKKVKAAPLKVSAVKVATEEEAKEYAAAVYIACAMEFVTGAGSTVGLPELVAGQAVKLLGLGLFSGDYHVTQVTHTMGSGGFTTSFQVRTDSLES